MNQLFTTVFKGFQAHTLALTVKTPKVGFPSVTLPTFPVKRRSAHDRPRRVGYWPGCAAGPGRQVCGGRPRLATVAVAAVCLLLGSSGVKGRRRLTRQIKPTVQKPLVSFHILSGARVSSEHRDLSRVCSQVEPASRGAHLPSSQPCALSSPRVDLDPRGPSWPRKDTPPRGSTRPPQAPPRAPPCQRARTRTRGGPPSRHPLSARPSHPTPLPRCPGSASATGQQRGGDRKPL